LNKCRLGIHKRWTGSEEDGCLRLTIVLVINFSPKSTSLLRLSVMLVNIICHKSTSLSSTNLLSLLSLEIDYPSERTLPQINNHTEKSPVQLKLHQVFSSEEEMDQAFIQHGIVSRHTNQPTSAHPQSTGAQ
jgi:hypothetical protein